MTSPGTEPVSADFIQRVQERLATRLVAREASRSPERPAPSHCGLHETASVLAWFDPRTIRPAEGASDPGSVDGLIADAVQVTDSHGECRWTLAPDLRVAVLRQLRLGGRVQAALTAAASPDLERPDVPLQRALDRYLGGSPPPLEAQSLEDLAATHQVSEWLHGAGFSGLPPVDAVRQRLEWLTLLQPFEHLAGRGFRGRARELQRLRSYAGVLPPGSALEATVRFVENVFSLREKPPLVIHGPGGVGKSTLIARFILEHAQAHEADRFPFAYLDFDRPDVSGQEPLTLLLEAVRQLGIEYPDARPGCERVRQGWLDLLARGQQGIATRAPQIKSSRGTARARSASVRDFATLIDSLGATDRPVLFVLDTFEEVQWRSAEHVAAIWRLLEELQEAVPRLRVVLAGRSDLPDRRTEELHLTGLDEEAAVGYLQAHGVADPAEARRLARQIGGSPLSLKLAAELAAHHPGARLDVSRRNLFFLQVDDAVIQRQLYKRVLDHIHDPDVRKLAHPGLALRRLTPELILEVLAAPCGLDISSPAQAHNLFEKLRREVALVSQVHQGVLVHRQDLRVLMLRLLGTDQPEKTRAIHERAVRFYERRPPQSEERAEEIYHRLQLGHDPAAIAARWLPGVEKHLGSALQELSGARRAFLASRLGVEVDAETQRLARLEDWERIVERKVRELLAEERPTEALDLLASRADRTPASPLFALHATALAQLERWSESLAVLDQGVESATAAGRRQPALALALQAAEVVLASGWLHEAGTILQRIDRLATGPLSPVERLETVARRLALSRRDPRLLAQGPEPLEAELRALFDGLPDEILAERPTLSCWAASVFRREDAGRLARVLRLTGLPRTGEAATRQLGAELASFDAAVSLDRNEAPGSLARRVDLGVRDSLTVTWTDFLLSAPDSRLAPALADVLGENAALVPSRLMEAFAAVLRSALGIERETSTRSASPSSASFSPPVSKRGSSARIQTDLLEALLEVFPSIEALRRFVQLRLERSLDTISLQDELEQSLVRLIGAATREGWLVSLVLRAREAQPTHAALAEIAGKLGISTLSRDPAQSVVSLLDPDTWRERLGEIEAQVCRVEAGGVFGTGFLVGVDLVLTADFVLAEVHEGKVDPAEVRLRFDYKASQDGQTLLEGTLFELESDWLAARSEWGTSGLGYALLRVRHSPGAQPIGGSTAEDSAALRRWIELVDPPPPIGPGAGLALVQHPTAGPLTLTTNADAVLGMSQDGTRLFYDIETHPGSSGAPCFTTELDLAAFHIGKAGGDPEAPPGSKVGVLLSAVVRDLQERGLGHLLGSRFL